MGDKWNMIACLETCIKRRRKETQKRNNKNADFLT